uniref:Uncharacterized protein n=1 Tax=Rhizophagus irregularis (strain DAOM 181602 / DAOM 197198 / MUCL 43194) TaxID=747089 RepID=U9UTH4_RHIID
MNLDLLEYIIEMILPTSYQLSDLKGIISKKQNNLLSSSIKDTVLRLRDRIKVTIV